MDVSGVDNILLNSFGMNEMGNIDVDKYQKGIFSPSRDPTSRDHNEDVLPSSQSQKVSSPQKSMSPHGGVPPAHFQHPLAPPPPPQASQQLPRMSPIPQANFQPPPHHHHMQRKVQLGPNFDRLGILNQANEIPPMSAPYFAKALQQHGGSTLGAILQAHQHALQQQMQRESFLLQQAVQQQMFQNVPSVPNVPFNIYHQQRMNSLMMDRRTDDQIVPNGQMVPPPESWLKHSTRPSPSKRMKIKHEDPDQSERRNANHYKHLSDSNDKYVIFNDENQVNQTSEDEDASPPIAPPKDSVFVRYPTDNYKTLPSFSDTFSGHIEKLKLKEQHLKESLLRHGVSEHMIPEAYATPQILQDNSISQQMLPDAMLEQHLLAKTCPQQQILPQTSLPHHLHPDPGIGDPLIPVSGVVDPLLPNSNLPHSMLPRVEDIKTERELLDSKRQTSAQYEQVDTPLKTSDIKLENDVKENASEEKSDSSDAQSINFETDPNLDDSDKSQEEKQLDYLNDLSGIGDVSDSDILSQCENEKTSVPKQQDCEKNKKNEGETFPENEERERENATNNINIFQADLDLDTDNPNYDNLFNGNSDEHYFQAFKENNLHLIADLNENKVDGGEDILKLLHSPLDFLNDKFLR